MSITRRPPPTLMVETDWSQPFVDFLALVLQKDQSLRPSAAECLEHPFLSDADGLHECDPHPLVFAIELNTRYKASKAAKAAKKAASKAASDAAAAAADGGDACCPSGHSLILYTTTSNDGAGTCDGCDRDIAHGTKVMDCRQCNYYLCDLCGAGRTEGTEGGPMGSSGTIGETKEGRTTGTDGEEGAGRGGGDDGGNNTSDTSDDDEDDASGTLTRQNSAELHEFDDMFGNGNTQMFATDWTLSDAPSGNAAADFAAAEEGAEMVAGGDADDARADSDNGDESFDSAGGTISVATAAIEKVVGGGYVDSSALNGAVGFLGDTEYDGRNSDKGRGTHGKETAATTTVAGVRSPSAAGAHMTCTGVGGGAPSMMVHAVLKGESYMMNRVDMEAKRDMLRELFQRNAHAAGTDTDTSTCGESFFGSEDGGNARVKGGAGAVASPVRSSAVAEGVDEEEDDMASPFTRAPRRGLLRKLVQRNAANFMAVVCDTSSEDKSEENAEASGVVGAAIAARRTKVRFATDDDAEAKVRTAEALAEMNAVLCSRPLISYPRRRKGILKGGASVEETSEDQYDDFEAAWKAQQEEDARRTAAVEGERFVREAKAEAAAVEAAAVAKAKATEAEAAAVATAKAAEEEAEAAILAKAVAAGAKAVALAAAEAAIVEADDLARREAAAAEAAAATAATAATAAVLVADPPLECSSGGVESSGGEGCDYVEGTAAVHVVAVESEMASEGRDVRVGLSNKEGGDSRDGDGHGAVFCDLTNRTCGHHHGESGSRGSSTGSNAGGLSRKRRLGVPARKRRGPVVDASALLLRVRALVSVDGGGADGEQRGGAAVGGGQLVGQQGGWPEAMASAETRFASRCGGGACGLCCDVHGRRTYSRKRSGNGRGWAHGGAKRKGQRNASNAVR